MKNNTKTTPNLNHPFFKTKSEITAWLDAMGVKKYYLIPDSQYGFIVNTDGDVTLRNKDIPFFPVKFNEIKGFFFCIFNNLTTLLGCPEVVMGDFSCESNELTSLEGCPQTINGSFCCRFNQIRSLKHGPITVKNHFYCNYNQIASLDFCPQTVGNKFLCDHNPLLGDTQNITDFKAIYQLHQHIVNIKKEREALIENIHTAPLHNLPKSKPQKI